MDEILITAEDFEIYKLLKEGVKTREIGERLNLKQRTIQNKMHLLYKKCNVNSKKEFINVPASSFRLGVFVRTTDPKVAERITHFKTQGISVAKMAARLGVCTNTIYNYIKKYEI